MDYITVEEAAERVGVAVATMRRRCNNGKVDAFKTGAQWLIDPASLDGAGPLRRKPSKPTTSQFDLYTAWKFVQSTDLAQEWVPDVIRFRDHIEDPTGIINEAEERLNNHTFGPGFQLDIPKTRVSNRPGIILDLPDRIAYQATIATFANIIESTLAETVYSSRLSTDGKHFLKHGPRHWVRFENAADKQARDCGYGWVAKIDISAYFEHVLHNVLFQELSNLGVTGEPLRVLRIMLSRWMPLGVGLPQGPNASRVLGNFYLSRVDQVMLRSGYAYHRFMDDVRVLTNSKEEAVAAVRQFEDLCRGRGLTCSSEKTEVVASESYQSSSDRDQKNSASYFFDAGNITRARPMLKSILKSALANETINQRDARFSIWRLARIRENTVLASMLNRLEDLAPLASVVAAYLKHFVGRTSTQRRIAEFMEEPHRSYSSFLRTWIFAAMLEGRHVPPSWLTIARKEATDKNQPRHLRSIAVCVMAKGRSPQDIAWIKSQLDHEHDPVVLRACLVGLKYGGALDKPTVKLAASRSQELARLGAWLSPRKTLPSLLYPDQAIKLG